jgi:hypothetical protein
MPCKGQKLINDWATTWVIALNRHAQKCFLLGTYNFLFEFGGEHELPTSQLDHLPLVLIRG